MKLFLPLVTMASIQASNGFFSQTDTHTESSYVEKFDNMTFYHYRYKKVLPNKTQCRYACYACVRPVCTGFSYEELEGTDWVECRISVRGAPARYFREKDRSIAFIFKEVFFFGSQKIAKNTPKAFEEACAYDEGDYGYIEDYDEFYNMVDNVYRYMWTGTKVWLPLFEGDTMRWMDTADTANSYFRYLLGLDLVYKDLAMQPLRGDCFMLYRSNSSYILITTQACSLDKSYSPLCRRYPH